jgi:lipoprotein-releasing system permease protein
MQAPAAAARWSRSLGPGLRVTDWSTEQASYFRAVRMEKMMMFVILSLIVAVAAFNIVATLVMVVNDKRTDIAILRTLGLAPGSVTAVFLMQGLLIGFIGVAGGLAGGLLLTLNLDTVLPWLESVLHIRLIPTESYYLDHIPVDLRRGEVAAIALTAFALSGLATVYPARRAAATQPAEALRYG